MKSPWYYCFGSLPGYQDFWSFLLHFYFFFSNFYQTMLKSKMFAKQYEINIFESWVINHFSIKCLNYYFSFLGFFGCQVNASVDILQLFEISKLCDGTPNCYLGSDESNKKLKCTSKLWFSFSYKLWHSELMSKI